MVILITGATHTGKTVLARRLVERYGYACLSLDLLKMGLIRSGNTSLTPADDDALTGYLWPIAREMVKTAIENRQDLIVEGCYIPGDWRRGFSAGYLAQIRYLCLVMSPRYIRENFTAVLAHANDAEQRLDDSGCTMDALLADNARYRAQCEANGLPFHLIDGAYTPGPDLLRLENE